METHPKSKKLALDAFRASFLLPALADWHGQGALPGFEAAVVKGRLAEGICWLTYGAELGRFDAEEAISLCREIARLLESDRRGLTWNDFQLLVRSDVTNRAERALEEGPAGLFQWPREELFVSFDLALELSGAVFEDNRLRAVSAASVFASDRVWEAILAITPSIVELDTSLDPRFDPWIQGSLPDVYVGLLMSAHHIERMLNLLRPDGDTDIEDVGLVNIRSTIADIHGWWFNPRHQVIRSRLLDLSRGFERVTTPMFAELGSQQPTAFRAYFESLLNRWADLQRPVAAAGA